MQCSPTSTRSPVVREARPTEGESVCSPAGRATSCRAVEATEHSANGAGETTRGNSAARGCSRRSRSLSGCARIARNGENVQDEVEKDRPRVPSQRGKRHALQNAVAVEEARLSKLEAEQTESRNRLSALRRRACHRQRRLRPVARMPPAIRRFHSILRSVVGAMLRVRERRRINPPASRACFVMASPPPPLRRPRGLVVLRSLIETGRRQKDAEHYGRITYRILAAFFVDPNAHGQATHVEAKEIATTSLTMERVQKIYRLEVALVRHFGPRYEASPSSLALRKRSIVVSAPSFCLTAD
jgi:hypothetical protein